MEGSSEIEMEKAVKFSHKDFRHLNVRLEAIKTENSFPSFTTPEDLVEAETTAETSCQSSNVSVKLELIEMENIPESHPKSMHVNVKFDDEDIKAENSSHTSDVNVKPEDENIKAENSFSTCSQFIDVNVKPEDENIKAENSFSTCSQFIDVNVKPEDENIKAENSFSTCSQFIDVNVKSEDEDIKAENSFYTCSQFNDVSIKLEDEGSQSIDIRDKVKLEDKMITELSSVTSSHGTQCQELCIVNKGDPSYKPISDEPVPSSGLGSEITSLVLENTQESQNLNVENETQQQSSFRIQVWDVLEKTGYASVATESIVTQLIEMLMNDTLETEEQLAALLGVKPDTQCNDNNDVDCCDQSLYNGLHEDFQVEIDIDETTDSCIEWHNPGTDVHTNHHASFKQKIFPNHNGPEADTVKIDEKSHNSCYKNVSTNSIFKSSIDVQKEEKARGNPKTLSHKCHICGKVYSRRSCVVYHTKVHTGEKPFKCLTCGKAFVSNYRLKQHMRTHSGEKPFKCLTCGKTYSQASNLKVHMRYHTGERPFKCLTCGKAFTHASNFKVHLRYHKGERPFKCLTCGKAFVMKHDLQVHTKTHTGDRPFKCLTCGKAFIRKQHFQGHIRTHMKTDHSNV